MFDSNDGVESSVSGVISTPSVGFVELRHPFTEPVEKGGSKGGKVRSGI